MKADVWLLLVGTGVFLGLGIPLSKLAADTGVPPLMFAILPTGMAALLFAALAYFREGLPSNTARLARFGGAAGLLGHAIPMSLLYWLTTRTGAGYAALAFTLPAVFTLAITLILRIEAPSARRGGAVAFGFCGAMLLASSRDVDASQGWTDFLTLLAIPLSIGLANVYRSRRMPPGASNAWMSAATLGSSALVLCLGGLVFGAPRPGIAAASWPYLVAQTVALVIGYLLYFSLQRRAEPVTFAFMGYVSMATGVIAGVFLFGERLALVTLPALVLILVALVMLRRAQPRRSGTRG